MCARCMLIWETELLKEKLEELGDELGCWFDVNITDNLMVVWKAYKKADNGEIIEFLSNDASGYTLSAFEEDVNRMPDLIKKAITC